MVKKEKIQIRKALKQLDKISQEVKRMVNDETEFDTDYMMDQLYPIDKAQGEARTALLALLQSEEVAE